MSWGAERFRFPDMGIEGLIHAVNNMLHLTTQDGAPSAETLTGMVQRQIMSMVPPITGWARWQVMASRECHVLVLACDDLLPAR